MNQLTTTETKTPVQAIDLVGVNPSWVEAFLRHPAGFRDYLASLKRATARVLHPDVAKSLPLVNRVGEINTAFDQLLGMSDAELVRAMEQYVSIAAIPSAELIAMYASAKRERDTAVEEARQARSRATELSKQIENAGEAEYKTLVDLLMLPWKNRSEEEALAWRRHQASEIGKPLEIRDLRGRYFRTRLAKQPITKGKQWLANVALGYVDEEGKLYCQLFEEWIYDFTKRRDVEDALETKLTELHKKYAREGGMPDFYQQGGVIGLISTLVTQTTDAVGHVFPPYMPNEENFYRIEVGRKRLLESCRDYLEQRTLFYYDMDDGESAEPVPRFHGTAVVAVGKETLSGVTLAVVYIEDFM